MNIRIIKCKDKVVWLCPKCKNKLVVFYTEVKTIRPFNKCKFCDTPLEVPPTQRV